jgi:cytidyltransferase-like protein
MLNKKPYKLGLVVGRFQVFHNGHEAMIRKSIELCEKTLVFVGSSQESMTWKNPFSYEFRKEIISDVFWEEILDDKLIIRPLKDIGVGNTSSWGAYVLSCADSECGMFPDLLVTGKEERRVSWFDAEKVEISELYVPKTIDISASEMRENMIQDNRTFWKSYTNPKLWKKYNKMRKIVLESQNNKNTMSV